MRTVLAIPILVALAGCSRAQDEPAAGKPQGAAKAPKSSEFLRFVRDDNEGGKLEVPAIRYRNKAGVEVTMYAAVHVADAEHYADLQKRFATHQALLYELIAEPDDRPTPGTKRRSGVSFLQTMLKTGLELEFQLDAIDYRAKNFVHADLTPRQFSRLQKERGESLVQLMFRAYQHQLMTMGKKPKGDQKPEEFDVVGSFRKGEGRHKLRMVFASMMNDLESLAAGFKGKDGKSVIVEERNQRAMEVMDDEIANGRKNLAIYYGAAHMPDFEQRLAKRGFAKVGATWLRAWDVTKRKDARRPRKSTEKRDG